MTTVIILRNRILAYSVVLSAGYFLFTNLLELLSKNTQNSFILRSELHKI